jgi:hypothetical protein
MLPADAPEMIRGRSRWSQRHLTTPIWFMPKVPPPDSSNALRPKDARVYLIWSTSWRGVKGHWSPCLAETSNKAASVFSADSIYLSISFLVPTCECLYNRTPPIPPRWRVRDVRSRKCILRTSQLTRASSSSASRAATSAASYSGESSCSFQGSFPSRTSSSVAAAFHSS